MGLIKRYPEGSDLTILNTTYHYPRKDPDTGKYKKGYIVLTYKDNTTGLKYHETIYDPMIRFYKANDDVHISHNMLYIEADKVHPIDCKFGDLEKTIAELTDNVDFFYENIKLGNRRANKQLHKIPTIFSSDMNIEDYYRAKFAREYVNEVTPITKGYFDIEADTLHMAGDFPELGECPINAISYIDDKTNTINVFLLRDITGENPQIQEFEDVLADPVQSAELYKELQQIIVESVGGKEKAEKFKIINPNIQFRMFDSEIELLVEFFRVVNTNSPDFMLAWNMAFDIPYIVERLKILGVDPALVMSMEDMEEKYAYYFIDEQHKNEPELRGDYYDIACHTVYLDQLIQFASRRKGQAAFPSFKLDAIADIVTNGAVRKLNYSHITTDISKFPYLNYKLFVLYNIVDTLAQKCIEETVNDIDYIYGACLINDTRYAKGHRQTVYLTNRVRKSFFRDGYILGNNCNSGEKVSYMGALVHDPMHNSDYAKLRDGNQIYNIVDNCDDFDFKALYPSETRENNLAPDTIIGKIFIDNPVHERENPYYLDTYDRGGQFLEDMCCENILEFCIRWLGLANFNDLLADIDEYYSTHLPVVTTPVRGENGLIKPFITHPDVPRMMIKPFGYLEEGEKIKPFSTDEDKDEFFKLYV